jgi:beta-mannosidase
MRDLLDQGWTLRAISGDVPEQVSHAVVPATVPGCVHTDLMTAGLIPDPFLDENEALVAWIGRADWQYRTQFEWSPQPDAPQVEIVADGLDTVATIELNGVLVGQTRNMHRSYRLPVAEHLLCGTNDLRVSFRSALDAAEQFSLDLGPRPATVEHPINAIRKMACNFGADWGPELITAGIWRPLGIESWARARIESVRPLVEIDPVSGAGILRAHVDVVRAPGWAEAIRVELAIAGVFVQATLAADVNHTVVEAVLDNVQVWWPHGWGEQPLYPATVSLHHEGGELDTWTRRIGFRAVTVDTVPDEHGTPFTFVVNGEPLFVRGVNWIPDDPFPARVDRARYRTKLTQARDLNANTVRVWGGGVYESEDFYDVCDELGLMVWQDFAFNCACYAEEEPLRGEIVAEAREAVTRLSCHPSLVLWNGCNENLWGYEDWNWKKPLGDRTWGAGYYFDLLPSIITELDPTRAYLPGSPYSMSRTRHPLDPAHGTTHIWEVWNDFALNSASKDRRPGPP